SQTPIENGPRIDGRPIRQSPAGVRVGRRRGDPPGCQLARARGLVNTSRCVGRRLADYPDSLGIRADSLGTSLQMALDKFVVVIHGPNVGALGEPDQVVAVGR